MGYEILLFSDDRQYGPFGFGFMAEDERIRCERGEIVFRRCAGPSFDTQVRLDGKPVTAICSREPNYFIYTQALLQAMDRNV